MINLSLNENCFPTSKKVLKAIAKVAENISSYPEKPEALLQAISERLNVSPKSILLGAGSSEVLDMICRAFLSAKHEVILPKHTFVLLPRLASDEGAKVVSISEKNFSDDLDGMISAITPKTGLMALVNPSNPLGQFTSFTQLKAFVARIPSHIPIVIDEAYYEFMDEQDYKSAVGLIKKYPNVIVVRTFSKAFGLAGLRLGYAVSSEAMIKKIAQFRKPYNVPSITLVAGLAAFNDAATLKKPLNSIDKNKKKLMAVIEKTDLKIVGHCGNFITIDAGEDALKFFEHFKTNGILLKHLIDYQLPDYLRITIGTKEQCERVIEILNSEWWIRR
jgi:histidinol-phosphate aminotransferase